MGIKDVFTKERLLLLSLTAFFLLVTSFFYENKTSYIHFVDEEENFVAGHFLLRGEKLYKDIFANHQPTAHVLSAGVQKVTNPSSIFLLVKRNREFLILWTLLWALFLVYRFGKPALGAVFLIETTKIFLLGNLFLAESLILYPLLYVSGLIYKKIKDLKRTEILFVGAIASFVFFSRSPMWPLLAFMTISLFLIQKKKSFNKVLYFLAGFSFVTLLVLPFISVPDYFKEAISLNVNYVLTDQPYETVQFGASTYLKSFIAPILSFTKEIPSNPLLTFVRTISGLYIVSILWLLKKKKYYLSFFMFMIAGVSIIRFIQPGNTFYRGFHNLVWHSQIIFAVTFSLFLLSKRKGKTKYLTYFVFSFLFILSLLLSKDELFRLRDKEEDYLVNYSKQVDLREAVNILAEKDDTLFVASDESLVYWESDAQRASRFIFYYSFMETIPYLAQETREVFENSPPTFLHCRCDSLKIPTDYLSNYQELEKDGSRTNLFVLLSEVEALDEMEKERLDFYRYSLSP